MNFNDTFNALINEQLLMKALNLLMLQLQFVVGTFIFSEIRG